MLKKLDAPRVIDVGQERCHWGKSGKISQKQGFALDISLEPGSGKRNAFRHGVEGRMVSLRKSFRSYSECTRL